MAKTGYTSPIAIHPGVTLKELLDELHMSQKELALKTGLAEETVNRIINQKKRITLDSALKFERVLGVKQSFWMKFQAGYDADVLRLKEKERFKKEISYLEKFKCYLELSKRGYVKRTQVKEERIEELLRFFGFNSLGFVKNIMAVAYRKSSVKKLDKEALSVWLRIGEIEARKKDIPEYNEKKLKNNLSKMRDLTVEEPEVFSSKLKKLCAEAGVILVYTKSFTNVPVNGATRWISPKNPLIQLSLKGAYADMFWFTFFHEVGHILKHGKKDFFVNYESIRTSECEKEADNFAQKILIPNESEYKKVFSDLSNLNSKISAYAEKIGVDRGIVAGRVAKETNEWGRCCRQRKKLQFSD
jgi:HTH-type transcriptional regulator/antitoxin HigA